MPFPSCVPFIFPPVERGQPEGFWPRIVPFTAQQLGLMGGELSPEPCCWLLLCSVPPSPALSSFLLLLCSAPLRVLWVRFLPGASRRHSHGPPALPRAAPGSMQEPGFLFFSFFCPNLSARPCVSRLGTWGVASESPQPHHRAAPRRSQRCHEKGWLRWHTPSPCFKREEFMVWKLQRMTTSWLASHQLEV